MSNKKKYVDLYGQESYFYKTIDETNDKTIVECVWIGEYEDRGSTKQGKKKLDKFYVDGYIGNTPIHDFDHNMIATGATWENIRTVKNYVTTEGKILEKALIAEMHIKDSDRLYYKDNNGVVQDRGSLRKAVLDGQLPFVSVYARGIDVSESDNVRYIHTFDIVSVSSISQPAGQQFSSTKIIKKNMDINLKKCLCNAYIPELKSEYYINATSGGIFKVLEATEVTAKIQNIITSEEIDVTPDDNIWEELIAADTEQVDEYLMNLANSTEDPITNDTIKTIENQYVKTFLKACTKCAMARQSLNQLLGQSEIDSNKEPKNAKMPANLKKEIDNEADIVISKDENIESPNVNIDNVENNLGKTTDMASNDKVDKNQMSDSVTSRLDNLEQSIGNLVNLVTEKVTSFDGLKTEIEKMQNELVLAKSWSKPKSSLDDINKPKQEKINLPFGFKL